MSKMTYTIDGGFITDLALEKFYCQNDLSAAITILKSCLINPEIPENEITLIILRILNKEIRIKGTYPDDDYGITENETFDPQLSHISEHIRELSADLDKYKTLAHNTQAELAFINENLSESDKIYLNELYEESYGERLFADTPLAEMDNALADFIEYTKIVADDDYGWLEPDGTFHPVPFAEHEKFAVDFLNEHYPFETNAHMYCHLFKAKGEPEHIDGGDVLKYSLGWILIHNPHRTISDPAQVDRDFSRRLTTNQKDFLTEYFTKRNLISALNEIIASDFECDAKKKG